MVDANGNPIESNMNNNGKGGLNGIGDKSRWVLLQNWGQCSVPCGGGTTTRQLICMKGKNGEDCAG